jgi:hypothetical protein
MNKKCKHSVSNELRTHSVNILFNLYELQELDMLREKKARAAYIRSVFFDNAPPPVPEINRTAYVDLAKTANDIHQIKENIIQSDDIDFNELQLLLYEFRLNLLSARDKS